jgi:hypothetical protein
MRLQQHWAAATDLLNGALQLQRLTGMRIGECVDLAPDCLRHLGDNRWSLQARPRAGLERVALLRRHEESTKRNRSMAREEDVDLDHSPDGRQRVSRTVAEPRKRSESEGSANRAHAAVASTTGRSLRGTRKTLGRRNRQSRFCRFSTPVRDSRSPVARCICHWLRRARGSS